VPYKLFKLQSLDVLVQDADHQIAIAIAIADQLYANPAHQKNHALLKSAHQKSHALLKSAHQKNHALLIFAHQKNHALLIFADLEYVTAVANKDLLLLR
jgi:hypothetical protein